MFSLWSFFFFNCHLFLYYPVFRKWWSILYESRQFLTVVKPLLLWVLLKKFGALIVEWPLFEDIFLTRMLLIYSFYLGTHVNTVYLLSCDAEIGETQIWEHIFTNSLDFLNETYLSIILWATKLYTIPPGSCTDLLL